MKKIFAIFCFLIFLPLNAKPGLPRFFSSHMVLQRDVPITIYGWDDAKKKVTVTFAGNTQNTITNQQGEWSVVFNALPAGGPYTMNVTDGEAITLDDIYCGDVWFCAGQSNMAFKLKDATNGTTEAKNAAYQKIKLLKVPLTMAGIPQKDIDAGSWQTCNPASAENFSAIAYLFGKELYDKNNVPIGLINASWGGTNIEAWTDSDTMGSHTAAAAVIAQMKQLDFKAAIKQYYEELAEWNTKADNSDEGLKEQWFRKEYNTQNWNTVNLPVYWAKANIKPNDGIVWLTRKVVLNANDLAAKNLTLSLGRIDDYDITYINGVKAGETNNDKDRSYLIPTQNFYAGTNVITVRVRNSGETGGFRGNDDMLYLKTAAQKISLAGAWNYQVGTKTIDPAPLSYNPIRYPSSLYNGMVAPFTRTGIKGFLWYQGENNSGNAAQYAALFKDMIMGWRAKWGKDYPFIFAQLPNFANQNNKWVTLREAQANALLLKNTGMAVLIDVGDDNNVHPANKQEPARRLALMAQNVAYSSTSAPALTTYKNSSLTGNTITILFTGRLAVKAEGAIPGFMVAGNNKKFYPAVATLQPGLQTITITCNEVPQPLQVRYLWADAPGPVALYDNNGMPVPPFRTDNW